MTRSRDELEKLTRGRKGRAAVVFFGSNEMNEYRAFWNTATQVIDSIFIMNDDQTTAAAMHVKQPSIMAFKRDGSDDPPTLYGGNLSSVADLKKFSVRESVPLVFAVDASYKRAIMGDEVLVFMLFVTKSDKFLINKFEEAGHKLGSRHRFAINTLKPGIQTQLADQCAVWDEVTGKAQLPQMIMIQKSNKHLHKYRFKIPGKKYIEQKGLEAPVSEFFSSFERGKLKPYFKSEKVPEVGFSNGVFKIVGSNFKSFLDKASEPVVVFFYYSFKDTDMAFAHDFTSIALEHAKKNPEIKFAMICIYRNEIAHFFDHSSNDNYSAADYPKHAEVKVIFPRGTGQRPRSTT